MLVYYIPRRLIISTKLQCVSIIDYNGEELLLTFVLLYKRKRDVASQHPNGTKLLVVGTTFICTQIPLP